MPNRGIILTIGVVCWMDAEDEINSFIHDMLYAQMALHSDLPWYETEARFSGGGFADSADGSPVLSVQINKSDIYSDEIKARARARLDEIIEAIGEGDRYTKLRRMTEYFRDNTFYDPYLDQINGSSSDTLATRGLPYDANVYGILLEGIAICDGFADSVKLICNELDIRVS